MKLAVFLIALISALSLSACKTPFPIDNAMSAVEGGDYTALIQGCGEQLSDGFLVCRKAEGDASSDTLYFVAPSSPPVKCQDQDSDGDGKPDPCVSFKIFFPDGSPSYGNFIPAGKTEQPVPWSVLLKSDKFLVGHRGFWGFSYMIRYLDKDGNPQATYTQGEIYLRVLKKGYVSLHSIENDPNFAMAWSQNGVAVKLTTAGRTYVEKKK